MTADLARYDALAVVDSADDRLLAGTKDAILRDIDAAPRRVEAMRNAAARHPEISYSTIKRWYYDWRRAGTAALVDRRRLRRMGQANGWLQCYLTYTERHNRSNKAAWRIMLDDLRSGITLPHGVGDWRDCWRREHPHSPVPADCPPDWTPRSARYENLQRAARANPDYRFQIIASRQGRGAAHQYLLPVLRTRAGLQVGQVYEFDDVHVDVEVLLPGVGRVARPQMFVGYDIASGYQAAEVSRPQYPESKGGKRNSLKEREFRMLNAWHLTGVGIHRDGSRLIIEHGTTAIRPGLEARIKSIPGYGALIRYERSGILSEAVHGGMFAGSAGGNFRLKAYCERMHRVMHDARGMLAGQVGQDAAHRPEGHAALVRYDQRLLEAVATLPEETREKIRYNLLDWPAYTRAAAMIMDRVMDATDHSLEGWDDRMITCWRLNEHDHWKPVSDLDDIAGDERDAILAYLRAHPEHKAVRRMSRREVWTAGQRNLVRIPVYELPLMLADEDARRVRVRPDGTLGFRDQFYYGADEVLYHATCVDRRGYRQALVPGSEYLLWTTPYHRDGAVISDIASAAVIGLAPAYKRVPIADRDALIRAAGAQNADLARKLLPIRGRHQAEAEQRMARIGANADALREAAAQPAPCPAAADLRDEDDTDLSFFDQAY